jgi:Fe-S-cluster containining protein
MTIEGNFDAARCAACGGACCKSLPGAAFPEDFPTAESVQEALATGRWALDWWEGDPREGHDELTEAYFLRPATKGKEGVVRDPSWGGECTFLTPKGCELPAERRPRECRMLTPRPKGVDCMGDGTAGKRAAAVAWLGRKGDLQ